MFYYGGNRNVWILLWICFISFFKIDVCFSLYIENSGRNIKFLNLGFYDVKFYYWFFKERFY